MTPEEFRLLIANLGRVRGLETMADLIEVIVLERETFDTRSALTAATLLDWEQAWDDIIGPALDRLEERLEAVGAVRP